MSPTESLPYSKRYMAWMLTLLVVMNALNLADRQGIAVSIQAIKLDLHFSDSLLGIIQGLGFAIFYSLMGLPLARLAERFSRTRLIAGCLALFGVMVALCGTAKSFISLLLFRIGVGVGDAGFITPVASLIGDYYPSAKRASVMSVIWLGAPIGVVGGLAGGSWITQHYGWRVTFVAIGAPAILIALIAFLTLREPPRGLADGERMTQEAPPSTWTMLRFLFAKRSMWHVLIGCGLAAISMNGIGQFLAAFLIRNFHLPTAAAGRLLALIAGASMASGLLIGGFGVDAASRRDKRWFVWGPALGIALAAPLFLAGLNQSSVAATVVVLIAAHVCMFVYYAPSLALAQNMVGANMRASSGFVVSVMLGLVGIGIGPTLVGFLSDRLASGAFTLGSFAASCPGGAAPRAATPALAAACGNASAVGLREALMVMSLLGLWSALHYTLAARHLRRDLETRYQPSAATLDVTTPVSS
jgi:predicted MFS family arabinose efflux permease